MTAPSILRGRTWVWPDDVNTDIIIPFRFKARTNDPVEMAKYAMYGFVGPGLESERYDNVSVHIIRPDPGPASQNTRGCHRYLLGSAIFPSMAEAAAVAGDER